VLRPEDAFAQVGSTGRAAAYCEARLMGEHGVIEQAHQVGEIQISGGNLFSGYLNLHEASAQAFDGTWYRTQDLAYRDDQGFYWVVGRSREMIISGGENVYPAEVEALLEKHPAIAEVAVVGLPHPRWGEQVSAAIVVKPSMQAPTLADLESFLQDRLARFKQPRRVFVMESLPKTALGKVQKPHLAKQLLSIAESTQTQPSVKQS
jgi:fatty-acyl-CoA synthase